MSEAGTVVSFHRNNGFLRPDIPGGYDRSGERSDDSVFFHASELRKAGIKTVTPGDRLTFDRMQGRRKTELVAGNLQIAA
jgi:cold shock CspA family protein